MFIAQTHTQLTNGRDTSFGKIFFYFPRTLLHEYKHFTEFAAMHAEQQTAFATSDVPHYDAISGSASVFPCISWSK
jgi:hypothetical protein